MVSRGFIVAATDYPGLGTDGPHPYLVGPSEARAVIDSVCAARNLAGAVTVPKFAAWGHSQGGQAVLYTAALAKEYAPELEIVGVAAAAPATELGSLMRADLPTPGGKNLLAMTLWLWARVYGAPIEDVVVPAALPTIDRLANVCGESLIDIRPRQRAGEELQQRFLSVPNLTEREPWRRLLAENTIGVLPPGVPVFIAQGTTDKTVVPSVTRDYVRKLCNAGSRVRTLILSDTGHAAVAMKSAVRAISWISDRFSGRRAPTDCP